MPISAGASSAWKSTKWFVGASSVWKGVVGIWVGAGGAWKYAYAFLSTITQASWVAGGLVNARGFDASHGSRTPTTLPGGQTFYQCYDLDAPALSANLTITGFGADPGIGFFTTITVGATTKTSASASYGYSAGTATWSWSGTQFGFSGSGTTTATII